MRSSAFFAHLFVVSSLAIVAGCDGSAVPDDTAVDGGGTGLDGSRSGDGSIGGDGSRSTDGATEASVVFDGSQRYPDGALVGDAAFDAHFDGGDGSTTDGAIDGAIDGSSGDSGSSELDAYEDVTLDGANRGDDAARNIEAGAPDVSFTVMCGAVICPPASFCCPSSGLCAPFECPECCPGGPIPPHP